MTLPTIHRRCGQHCGQTGCAGPQAANLLRAAFIAQTLSSKKALRINDLLEHDTAVTGIVVGIASASAVVEFFCRTSVEVAGG
jgi:methyl coenzyme M reductase beta subunit